MPLDEDADGLPDHPVALDRLLQVHLLVGQFADGQDPVDRQRERLREHVRDDLLVRAHHARLAELHPGAGTAGCARRHQQDPVHRLLGRRLVIVRPGQSLRDRLGQQVHLDRPGRGEGLHHPRSGDLDRGVTVEERVQAVHGHADDVVEGVRGREVRGDPGGLLPAVLRRVLAGHVPERRQHRRLAAPGDVHHPARGPHPDRASVPVPHREVALQGTAERQLPGRGLDALDAARVVRRIGPPGVRRGERPVVHAPAEQAGERGIQLGHPAVGIAQHHRLVQRRQHGAAPRPLRAAFRRPQDVAGQARPQVGHVERLDQVVVRAVLQPGGGRVLPGAGRQQQHRQVAQQRVGPDLRDQPETVQPRHHHVGEHRVRTPRAGRRERLQPVAGELHLVVVGEHLGQVAGEVGAVLDHEQPWTLARRGFRQRLRPPRGLPRLHVGEERLRPAGGDRARALDRVPGLRRHVRQPDGEGAAATGRGAQVDVAAEQPGQLAHHGEPDPGALGAARLRVPGQLLEPGEDPVLVADGDADAAVGDAHLETAAHGVQREVDRAARGVLQRVGEQVQHDSLDDVAVEQRGTGQLVQLGAEPQAGPLDRRAERRGQRREQGGDVELDQVRGDPAGLHPAEVEHGVDHPGEPDDVAAHGGEPLPEALGDLVGGCGEHVGQRRGNQRERRAQLVADVGEEGRLRHVQFPEGLGLLPDDGELAASAEPGAEQGGGHLEVVGELRVRPEPLFQPDHQHQGRCVLPGLDHRLGLQFGESGGGPGERVHLVASRASRGPGQRARVGGVDGLGRGGRHVAVLDEALPAHAEQPHRGVVDVVLPQHRDAALPDLAQGLGECHRIGEPGQDAEPEPGGVRPCVLTHRAPRCSCFGLLRAG